MNLVYKSSEILKRTSEKKMPPWKSVQTLNAGAFMASNLSNTPSEILKVQYHRCKYTKKTQCWFSKRQTRVMSKSQSTSVWLISWEVDYLQQPLVTDALASTQRPLILEQFHPCCLNMQTCTLHSQTRVKERATSYSGFWNFLVLE